ncbi:MAG: AMP-dependent synthetase, partial [Proteobacteria bacterium]
MKTTLHDLIDQHPDHAIAIGEPGREWLTYAGLRSMAISVRQSLRQFGIGAQDRVAIVLANGSDMASAFVTIAQAATTAPLNPSYREDEFVFY